MIVRFPLREPDRARDPGWQAEKAVQPDPTLRDERTGPAVIGIAALVGVAIVVLVFYGLTREPEQATASGGSASPAITTAGQAPATDANAPSPADKANTAAHGTSSGQSGKPQPANQGQGTAGKSGENR